VGYAVESFEALSLRSLSASSPLVKLTPAAFCFSCQHWKTYDQARARASRAWPKEMSQSGRWEECLLVIKHFVRALELARTGAYAQALEEGNVEV
jgi:hypothetical protein